MKRILIALTFLSLAIPGYSAAPVAGKIILPSDTGNTGPKLQTQSEVIGSDTVVSQYVISRSPRRKTGVYVIASSHTVQASAQVFGTTAGFFWLINPVGSTITMAVRRINIQTQFATALAVPTAPRISFLRFSFAGTASGTQIAATKRKTGDAAAQGQFRTTSAGMSSLTSQGDIFNALPGMAQGTAGWAATPPAQQELVPNDEDGYIVLVAGEGLACLQPDAGTASDTRKVMVNIGWEEFE